jgi:hypothetical protein
MWKQRLLRGSAPWAERAALLCSVDGDDDKGDDKGGGGADDKDKAFAALTTKNAELLDELKKVRAKQRELDADEADRQKKLADAEEAAARQKGDWEKIENTYKEKLAKTEGDGYLWRSKYEALVIDRGLDEALTGAKVNPALSKAAVALIKAEHGVELDDQGRATITGKPLADFVAEWSKSDTGKAFVLNGSGGGGANGSGGGNNGGGGDGNPFKSGASFNRTEQGRLLKADPAKARRLAAEAGVKL